MEKEIKEESDVVMEDDKKPATTATPAPKSPVKKSEKASEAPKEKPVVKELDEKQKTALKSAYKFPSEPSILVHPHPKGQLILKCLFCKVEKILKGSLDLIPSPSMKNQIVGGKLCLRCNSKSLLDDDITQQDFALLPPIT